MLTTKNILYCVFFACLLTSCRKEFDDCEEEVRNFKLLSRSFETEGSIKRVDVFLMTDGVLSEKHIHAELNENGTYPLLVKDPPNTRLLFLVNGDMPMEAAETGKSTERSFLAQTTPAADYVQTHPLLFYTGEKEMEGVSEPTINVPILRSIARLNLKINEGVDVEIDSCLISNIADRSCIFPSSTESPAGLKLVSASLPGSHFTASPSKPQNGFFYLYESLNAGTKAEFFVKISGIRNKLEVALPSQIERDKDYNITINSRGATLFASLQILPWQEGTELNARPAAFDPLAESVESERPAFIYLNATGDTLFAPAQNASCTLVIKAGVQVELRAGSNIAIESVNAPGVGSSYLGNTFKLTFADKNINEEVTYSKIYIKDQSASQYYDQYLVVVRPPGARAHFSNLNAKATIHGRNINFNGYIDGVISDMTFDSPPVSVACETNDPDFNWLRLDLNTEVSYRIEGGFKPNDSEATGQEQRSTVRVEYADGLVEEFQFTRKRRSIPVVFIAGKYWSKFNMRGNSKSYEDQIGFGKDQEDLFTYLKTCSSEEYLYYAGANYKGRSQQGMYLKKNEKGELAYPEYGNYKNGSTTDASPFLHCPEGYNLPHKNDFGAVMHLSSALPLPANNTAPTYTSSTGISYTIERYQRDDINIDGVNIPHMYHVKVTDSKTGHSLVWAGIGHQWDNTGADPTYWIYALINPGSSSYYSFIHSSNVAKMELHNQSKTRLVRCIKSPVTYIINDNKE